MSNWDSIVMDNNDTIDMCKCRPAHIVDVINEATERRLWHESEAAKEDGQAFDEWRGDVPWWYPVREKVNSKYKAIARAARSVVVGTQWIQSSLYKASIPGAETPWCQACDQK